MDLQKEIEIDPKLCEWSQECRKITNTVIRAYNQWLQCQQIKIAEVVLSEVYAAESNLREINADNDYFEIISEIRNRVRNFKERKLLGIEEEHEIFNGQIVEFTQKILKAYGENREDLTACWFDESGVRDAAIDFINKFKNIVEEYLGKDFYEAFTHRTIRNCH